MSEKTFLTLLKILVFVLLAFTVAHLVYAYYAYNHCSIIYFIGKELW